MANSAICPFCGCSLVRLGITRADATSYAHEGEKWWFCCQGCLDGFLDDPPKYLTEVRDWIVCPTCLAEKPKQVTVSISHEGQKVHFCRCPCCIEDFFKRPAELVERLET